MILVHFYRNYNRSSRSCYVHFRCWCIVLIWRRIRFNCSTFSHHIYEQNLDLDLLSVIFLVPGLLGLYNVHEECVAEMYMTIVWWWGTNAKSSSSLPEHNLIHKIHEQNPQKPTQCWKDENHTIIISVEFILLCIYASDISSQIANCQTLLITDECFPPYVYHFPDHWDRPNQLTSTLFYWTSFRWTQDDTVMHTIDPHG